MMKSHRILVPMLIVAALTAARLSADPTANLPRQFGLVASLSNGVSIEILGIGENPSTDKQWWLANGDLLDTPPYARMQDAPAKPSAGCLTREFAVHTNWNRPVDGWVDGPTMLWEVSGDKRIAHHFEDSSVEDEDGKVIAGIEVHAMAIPDTPGGATIHATVAAGKWNTVLTLGPEAWGGFDKRPGCPKLVVLSQAFTVKEETHVFFIYEPQPTLELRLAAVDLKGKTVYARFVGNGCGSTILVCEYAVDLPLKSIREWQLQSRSFDQWIEIRGIALHPGRKTNPTIVTSDDQEAP